MMFKKKIYTGLFTAVLLASAAMLSADELNPDRNLFNVSRGETATIQLNLSTEGLGQIKIYDRYGREVIELANSTYSAGVTPIDWDGRDQDGDVVSAGVYHALVTEGSSNRRLKIIVIK